MRSPKNAYVLFLVAACVASLSVVRGALASPLAADDPLSAAVENARKTHNKEQLQSAKTQLEQKIAQQPSDAGLHFDLARVQGYLADVYEMRKDKKAAADAVDKAIDAAQRSIRLNDKSPDAHSLRLEDDTVDRGLQETVRRLRRRRRRPITAAIDGTGLSDTSVSTFFHRRLEQQAHGTRPRRPRLKWLIVADVRQQILLAQRPRQARGCDTRSLPGLLDVAARGAPIGMVLADAEFDSEANHEHIRQRLGAKSIIPAGAGCPQRRHSKSDVSRQCCPIKSRIDSTGCRDRHL